ncbi:MAG: protein kinase, partial [Nannocystaceae bacterium]
MNDPRSDPSGKAPLPPGIPDISGTVLDGRYQIGPVLGAGGMGAVFEARHLRLDRRVAVKVLKPTLMHRDDYVARFLREARSASKIRHPNVVEILDYGEMTDRTVYTVMELLLGEDLSSRLKRVGRMSWGQSRWILVQIVRALHAAHSQGIIHRDIKPANCFLLAGVQGQELVKVLDFGIAKLDQLEADERPLTGTSEILGTPSYMAPEMARGISADPRSEVYSVGVLAYRMLGGKVPFDGNNAFDVLLQHATQPPPPLQSLVPDLPHKVVELVHLLLQKDPETRPQDMAKVEELMLSIGVDGKPCDPSTQSVYPMHPSSSGSAPLPRSVIGSGIHPTPSGSLSAPPTPPPFGIKGRDPTAKGMTVRPPGGPRRARSSGPSPAPHPNPSDSGSSALGTANTVFSPPPARSSTSSPSLPSERPTAPPLKSPGFSKPRAPRLDGSGPPGPRKPGARRPGLPSKVAEPEATDRTMLTPSPVYKPPSRPSGSPPRPSPSQPDVVDRTVLRPQSTGPAGNQTGAPSAPPPAPAPAPAPNSDGADKTVVHMAGGPRAAAAEPPGVERTVVHMAPSAPPAPPPGAVDRTMIHPSPSEGGGDLADRTMIQPPSAAMGGGPIEGDRPKRTLMLDGPEPAKNLTDRTMVLDPSAGDPLELMGAAEGNANPVTSGRTQIVEINDATRAQFLAAAGIDPQTAGQGAPQPAPPSATPFPHNYAAQSGPIPVGDHDLDSGRSGSGRWIMLALLGGLLAVGAGGLLAWMLFANDDDDTVAAADDGEPAADDDEPAADDGEPAADDGEPAADDGEPAADDGEPAADDGEPAADDG